MKKTTKGIKNDSEKLQPTLLPIKALRGATRVLMFGAKKYSRNNWRYVEKDRYKDALVRHLWSYLEDPKGVDEESGFPHIDHLLCNALILAELEKEEVKEQTRVEPNEEEYYEGIRVKGTTESTVTCHLITLDSDTVVCDRCRKAISKGNYTTCPNCGGVVIERY